MRETGVFGILMSQSSSAHAAIHNPQDSVNAKENVSLHAGDQSGVVASVKRKKILFILPVMCPGGAERVLITLMNIWKDNKDGQS